MKSASDTYKVKFLILCLFLSTIIIGFGEVLIRRDTEHEMSLLRDNMLTTGSLIAQEIQKNISAGIFVTETLQTLLKSEDYSTEKFEEWGKQMISINHSATTIQLAPDGIVRYIYPFEGNEKVFGHDLLKDERRNDGALKTIQSQELTFIGPVKLIQNGELAVIARLPIFSGEEADSFWGFSIALLLVGDIIPESQILLEENGIHFSLEGEDPDSEKNPVFFSTANFKDEDVILIDIAVPNGKWILKMNHDPIYNRYYGMVRLLLIVFVVLLSSYIFSQQIKVSKRSKEISELNSKLFNLSMVDELTGVGNRRAGIESLENLILLSQRYEHKLCVIMIDLDYFKEVNDKYGHHTGDEFLQHFAQILKSAVRESDSVIRLGGDEFLLILPETDLNNGVLVSQKLQKLTKSQPYQSGTTEIPVCLSMGIADYQNEKSSEELLKKADIMLYKAKESGRSCCRFS